jgi:hypothetical protein
MRRFVLNAYFQLNAAPPEQPAPAPAPPTAKVLKDAGVTQAMKDAGVAAPSASMRPVRAGTTGTLTPRADVNSPPGLQGEDAAFGALEEHTVYPFLFDALLTFVDQLLKVRQL